MNIGEVAAAAGVSVRTLHHWDAVGLLVPSTRTPAGYRSYSLADLERLRQVLTYRELGFSLEDVTALLDDPSVDAVDHLRRQQSLLADRISHLQSVQALVRRAVEEHMGLDDLQEVFGDEDPTRYDAEAEQRWGDTDAYRQSRERTSTFTKDDWAAVKAQGHQLERRFAEAMNGGVAPVDAGHLAVEHRAWISRSYDCTPQMQLELARMYVADERFAAHYDAVAPGLAQYVHDVIAAAVT